MAKYFLFKNKSIIIVLNEEFRINYKENLENSLNNDQFKTIFA